MKQLVFIARMEKLNLPFNAATFATCNKDSLVEGRERERERKRGIFDNLFINEEINIISFKEYVKVSVMEYVMVSVKCHGLCHGLCYGFCQGICHAVR